jgi:thioredoxin:protein disulfide reductase
MKPARAEFAALAAGAVLSAVFGVSSAAGLPDAPKLLRPEQAFRLSARALDPVTVEARFDVADGYYLYRDKMRFTLEPVAGLVPDLPRGIRKHDQFFGEVETYRGAVVVRLPLAHAMPGRTITLHAESQGCADVGICYPPTPQQLKLEVPANGARPGGYVEAGGKGWFK